MNRNWAAFTSVALVAVLLAAIGVVGATQGMFGFKRGEADALEVVQLERAAGDGVVAAAATEQDGGAETALAGPSVADASSTTAASDALRTAGDTQTDGGATDTETTANDALPPAFEDDERSDDAAGGESGQGEREEEDDDYEHRSEALVAATPGVQTFQVGEAGLVTLELQGSQLSVLEVAPAPGWAVRDVKQEDGGNEVQVELRAGEREVTFSAHFEDGQIHASVGLEYEDD